jgi:hypothetical protein
MNNNNALQTSFTQIFKFTAYTIMIMLAIPFMLHFCNIMSINSFVHSNLMYIIITGGMITIFSQFGRILFSIVGFKFNNFLVIMLVSLSILFLVLYIALQFLAYAARFI